MANLTVLDFPEQAAQLLDMLEPQLRTGNKEGAKRLLVLKLKSMYETGVFAGKEYVKRGTSPFQQPAKEDFF